MNDVLIISDLHLAAGRPGVIELFIQFLREQVTPESRVYILGDLFDAWIGDDDNTPPLPAIKSELRRVTQSGAEVFFMHGNRDFLVGDIFANETGCSLLDDPAVVHINDIPTLLMHGDLLCTDDLDYMKARAFLRDPAFIESIMVKSIEERQAIAADFRKRSGEANSLKAEDIMDVNQQTVERYMTDNRVTQLIHGHTHRPAVHHFELDGEPSTRRVLPEWHEHQGSFLKADGHTLRMYDFDKSSLRERD